MADEKEGARGSVGRVVLAAHLASGGLPELSEVEYALTMTTNAFQRWMVRCMAAAGYPGLTPLEILVLHSARHRGRQKTLAELCLILNIEDTHLVNYALKKLEGLSLIRTGKLGKEKTVSIAPDGEAACQRYHEVREEILIDSIRHLGLDPSELSTAARLLRVLSGHYDQASRGAVSL